MTWHRHDLAQRAGVAAGLSVLVLPLLLACDPTRGSLNIEATEFALVGGEQHFILRASPAVLEEAVWMSIDVRIPNRAEAITLLPDAVQLAGTSVGDEAGVRSDEVVEWLRAGCSEAMCEVGFTVIVSPHSDREAIERLTLTLSSTTEAEQFSDDAILTLQVDGEEPLLAVRGSE